MTTLPSVEETDTFMETLPTTLMRERMREAVLTYLEQMELDGKKLSDIKNKAELPCKIANKLKLLEVEGWVGLQVYHLRGNHYKMFKSL